MKALESNTTSFALVVLISLLGGAVSVVAYDRYVRPPPTQFKVVDMTRMLEPIMSSDSLSDAEKRRRAQRLGEDVRQWMLQETARGVVVLDGSVVLGAPEKFYVSAIDSH